MNGTIYLNFSGLLYTFLIAFCFFSKKRVNSHETKIYSGLLIVSILELVIGLVSTYCIYFNVNYIFKAI